MTFDKPDSISRRGILERAGLLGTALTVGLSETASGANSNSPTPQQLKVIVAGGHPGDPEYGCGGTVARYADLPAGFSRSGRYMRDRSTARRS